MTTKEQRAKFEAWWTANQVRSRHWFTKCDGEYENRAVEEAWRMWQAAIASQQTAAKDAEQWVSIQDHLPPLYQTVALLNVNRWMNTGNDDFNTNWHGAGWLSEFGHKYWSVIGEHRAMTLDSVTHWMPLPSIDAAMNSEKGNQNGMD